MMKLKPHYPFGAGLLVAALIVFIFVPQARAAVIDTWILSGQSNAEGYAITESPVPGLQPPDTLASAGRFELDMTHSNVRFYQGLNDYNHVNKSAGLNMSPKTTWHAMEPYEGLCYDWGNGRGNESGRRFGPELTFGYDIQQLLGTEIAIIKFARASTSIASSSRQLVDGSWNDFDPSDGGRLNQYDKLITTLDGAVASLTAGDTLRIQGVLWMQGEGDANAAYAGSYEANLTEFIAALRLDIADIAASSVGAVIPATSWDELKFFIATIYTPTGHGDTVRAAQNAVAAADPMVFIVDGHNDITLMTFDDWGYPNLHYDTDGQILLGERFAAAVAIPGDLTLDRIVNMEDIAKLGSMWLNNYFMNTLVEIADNWLVGTLP